MTLDFYKLIGEDWREHYDTSTDSDLFQEKIVRLWRQSWLYVAHESEIPHPGDFLALTLAQRPVLVVRGEDDRVRMFLNICRHRAVTVCQEEKGNAKHFTCAFHGWVYDTKGSLIGLSGLGCAVRRFAERRGLTSVPRLDVYRGFLFASLSPTGESLNDYLGKAKFFIDLVVDQSSAGIEVVAPRQHYRCQGNLKLSVKNGGGGQVEDLSNGHALLQLPASSQKRVISHRRKELEQRLGPEKTKRICETERTLFIAPNLFLSDRNCASLCIIEPGAPGHMEVSVMPFAPKNEPTDMTVQRLRHYKTCLEAK